MSYADNPYRSPLDVFAAQAAADERAGFITKTYTHLAGAIGLFALLECVLLQMRGIDELVRLMIGGRISWLIVLGLFIVVSHVANSWAVSATSPGQQYAGLILYTVAEAVIFVPILYICGKVDPGIIPAAAVATLALFGALTAVVFITRKDFSFLRSVLMFGGFAALGFIVVAILFNFTPGPIFTYLMIAFACGYILYDTSNVMHHYRIGQHVAAALACSPRWPSLFWYISTVPLAATVRRYGPPLPPGEGRGEGD